MKNNNGENFLAKINARVKDGDFDAYLTIPFMTRELFLASIKSHLAKKISIGGSSVLSDTELRECLSETKDTAVNTAITFMQHGLLEQTEEGLSFTEKGYQAIAISNKNNF